MQGKKDEKKKTQKRTRAPHFKEPKAHKAHTIKRHFRCPHCGAQVRTNKDKRIAWHRTKHMGKWCSRSATKYLVA